MPLPTPTYRELFEGRKSGTDTEGYVFGTRVFEVLYGDLSGATTGEIAQIDTHAISFVPINRWDPYPGQPLALCVSAGVSNGGQTGQWLISYEYTSKLDGQAMAGTVTSEGITTPGSGGAGGSDTPSSGDKQQNPESRPLEVRSIKRTIQVPLERDAIYTAIRVANTAGDAYDPPPMVEKTYLGYSIKFFRSPANLKWKDGAGYTARPAFLDTCNLTAFKIFGKDHSARTLRVSDVGTGIIWDKNPAGGLTATHELTVEILHDPNGWKVSLLSQGLRQITGPSQPPTPILDPMQQPITEPVPLDGTGARLAPGGAFVYTDFWKYPELELRGLFT